MAGGADQRPTDASVKVLEEIEKDLVAAGASYDALVHKEIPSFNKAMGGRLPAIRVLTPPN